MFNKKILCMYVIMILCVSLEAAAVSAETTPNSLSNPQNIQQASGFIFPEPRTGPMPLLTILINFSDLPHTRQPSVFNNMLFGPRPSMNDYYNETSYGNFYFADKGHWMWITAWDDPSTSGENDTLYDESTVAYWNNLKGGGSGKWRWWALKSLDMHGFDFTQFDTDGDNKIGLGDELAFLIIDSRPETGGSVRWLKDNAGGDVPWYPKDADLVLDGKQFYGSGAAVDCGAYRGMRYITLCAHELVHQALNWPYDYYAENVKPESIIMFSIMGDWWGPHHFDPYLKMKMGWLRPTVIMNDGWYNISNSELNSEAYILHDPAHGTHEYFLIENRWMGSSYDNVAQWSNEPLSNILDEGLLVWHIDESRNWNGSLSGGYSPVQLVLKKGSGGHYDYESYKTSSFNGDDLDYYDLHDHSSPKNTRFYNGNRSNCGIWSVSGAGAEMRAYFDVPGAGILATPEQLERSSVPGTEVRYDINLVNTGESLTTVKITIIDLPSGLVPDSALEQIGLASKEPEDHHFFVTFTGAYYTPPGVLNFNVCIEFVSDPTVRTVVPAIFIIEPWVNPVIDVERSVQPAYGYMGDPLGPGEQAAFWVIIQNRGNVDGRIEVDLDGISFGNTYEAAPDHIPDPWFEDPNIIYNVPSGNWMRYLLFIHVPENWAGKENAVYEFELNAESETGHTYTYIASVEVNATPESKLNYIQWMLKNSPSFSKLPEQDLTGSLDSKVESVMNKIEFASVKYAKGELGVVKNLLGAAGNKMEALIHQTEALSGKTLDEKFAHDIIHEAEIITGEINEFQARLEDGSYLPDFPVMAPASKMR